MTNRLLLSLLTLALAGCFGGHLQSSGSSEESFAAEVENLRLSGVATIEPTRLYFSDYRISKYKLGAAWSSLTSRKISLVVADAKEASGYGSAAVGLAGVDIEIDGKTFSYTASLPDHEDEINYAAFSTTIDTARENFIVIPYSTYKKMLSAKDCTIRIHTKTGMEVVRFSIEHGPDDHAGALVFFRNFDNMIEFVK